MWTGVALASIAAALMFGWLHFEPFRRAQRDADRVFHELTGAAPLQHQRSGNYLGFDQAPTVTAYGPLPAPTTVRTEMARFTTALDHAGYHPSSWSQQSASWCSLVGGGTWAPTEAAPPSITVRCGVDAANAARTATARLTLEFQVPPTRLRPTRTATGYFSVAAEAAVDLAVTSGTVECSVTRHL
jgi:hypothetical protein